MCGCSGNEQYYQQSAYETFQVQTPDEDADRPWPRFQFQNEMQLPLGLTGDPNVSSSWFHNGSAADVRQPMMLQPDVPGLLHHQR
jgi:hypothetical protein